MSRPANGVAQLVAPYGLPAPAADKLERLLDLVASDPLAPTTVKEPRRVLDDHLADSLVALEVEEVRTATKVADLGAGAGFPGLPLAIALPNAAVALVESSNRKCAFISRAIEACGVTNAQAVHTRVESWDEGFEMCDLVTARALAPLEVVVEYAAPLLRLGGSLVVWRGRRDGPAESIGAAAASELGLEVGDIRAVQPYSGAEHRHLHVIAKRALTPPGFPRRPGVARKRPLGRDRAASDRVRR
jgi:16S rRNA (guanine527-N7)-methyltransferase